MPLITIDDVKAVRRISETFDDDRFNSFAQSAQDENLRIWLGDALYYDLITNSAEANYQTLLNGTSFTLNGETIKFFGLKIYLAYVWLSIFAIEGDEFQSNVGTINFMSSQPNHHQLPKSKKVTAEKYQSSAIIYKNNTIDFLTENQADYPLWDGAPRDKRTKFKFNAI